MEVDRLGDEELMSGGSLLPLICPSCLCTAGREVRLESGDLCPCCGVRYPVCNGVPLLLTDEGAKQPECRRNAGDTRSRFFHETANRRRQLVEGQIDHALTNVMTEGMYSRWVRVREYLLALAAMIIVPLTTH